MRRLRWWHWVLMGVATAGMIAAMFALLLFAPGIQRRVFLGALEAPGRTVEVAHLSAGWNSVEIQGLVWEEGGQRFAAREVRAIVPVLDALGRGPVVVEQLEVRGFDMALPGTGAPEAAMPHLRLPASITVLTCSMDGELTLDSSSPRPPGNTSAAARRPVIDFNLKGNGIGPGAANRLTWTARVRESSDAIASGTATGEIGVEATEGVVLSDVVARFQDVLRAIAYDARRQIESSK